MSFEIDVEIDKDNVEYKNRRVLIEVKDVEEFVDDLSYKLEHSVEQGNIGDVLEIMRILVKIKKKNVARGSFFKGLQSVVYDGFYVDVSTIISVFEIKDEIIKILGKSAEKSLRKIRNKLINSPRFYEHITDLKVIINKLELGVKEEKDLVRNWASANKRSPEKWIENKEILKKHIEEIKSEFGMVFAEAYWRLDFWWEDYYKHAKRSAGISFHEALFFMKEFWDYLDQNKKKSVREFFKEKIEYVRKLVKRRINKKSYEEAMKIIANLSGDNELKKIVVLKELE